MIEIVVNSIKNVVVIVEDKKNKIVYGSLYTADSDLIKVFRITNFALNKIIQNNKKYYNNREYIVYLDNEDALSMLCNDNGNIIKNVKEINEQLSSRELSSLSVLLNILKKFDCIDIRRLNDNYEEITFEIMRLEKELSYYDREIHNKLIYIEKNDISKISETKILNEIKDMLVNRRKIKTQLTQNRKIEKTILVNNK